MSKIQFLLFFVIAIPAINVLLLKAFAKSKSTIHFINKAFPTLFLMNVFGFTNLDNLDASLVVFTDSHFFSFGFSVNHMTVSFLYVLNFIWLIFVFYASAFSKLFGKNNATSISFPLSVMVLMAVLTIVSSNLLTLLVSYSMLLFLSYFFAKKQLFEKDSQYFKIFIYCLASKAIFLLFAFITTCIFSGENGLNSTAPILENASLAMQSFAFYSYLGCFFLISLTPIYLLFRKMHLGLISTYTTVFFIFGFTCICASIKMLIFVFGSGFIQSGLPALEWIFLINLLLSSFFLLSSKSLKTTFFHLFFNQLNITIFAIVSLASFAQSKMEIPLISFALSFTLLFMCFSNLTIHANSDERSDLGIVSKELFGELTMTCMLLAFAILNVIGIVPGLGMFEKFFLIKAMSNEGSYISEMIVTLNFLTMVAFGGKMFYPFFEKGKEATKAKESELNKIIDSDSGLMLTALITAIIIALLPIILN